MKFKKIAAAVLSAALAAMCAGCSSNTSADSNSADASAADKDSITVGVIQYGSHPSLDNCYQGVEEGLMASEYADKIVIDRQDGNFDSATCDSIAKNMASKIYDLIFAIATPAAVSAY